MWQDAARMRKNLDPARSPPPLYRLLAEIFAGYPAEKGLETPLAAGLAAGAGGLGSLEALAVRPWAQEFLYAAIYRPGRRGPKTPLGLSLGTWGAGGS